MLKINKNLLKSKSLKRIAKGSGLRIGKDALKKIELLISRYCNRILERAGRSARLSGRKTIIPEDIPET